MKRLRLAFFILCIALHAAAQSGPDQVINFRILDHKHDRGADSWSPDGKKLILFSPSERSLKLLDIDSDQILWTTTVDEKSKKVPESQTIVWSRDQRMVAMGDEAGNIRLFETRSGKLLWHTVQPDCRIEMLNLGRSKFLVAVIESANSKQKIAILDVMTGKLVKVLPTRAEALTAISIDYPEKNLTIGDVTGKISSVNIGTGTAIRTRALRPCPEPKTYMRDLDFSGNLKYLAARCGDHSVVTETATGNVKLVVPMDADFEKGISFSGDENVLGLENLGGYKIIDLRTNSVTKVENGILGVFDRQGIFSLSSTGYRNRGLQIVDVRTGKTIRHIENHPGDIKKLAFNGDGSRFASASADGFVRVWATNSRRLLWSKFAFDRGVNTVAFSPDSKTILAAGKSENDDNPLKVSNAENGEFVRDVKTNDDGNDGIREIVFSPDGKMLLTTGGSVVFKLWSTETWQVLRTFRTNESHSNGNFGYCCGSVAESIAFDKAGKRILSAHDDGTLKIWDVDKTDPVRILNASDGSIRAFFSPDEKRILVISATTSPSQIVDAEDGKNIQTFRTGLPDRELDYVTDAAFRKDGNSFFTTSWFDDVMLWDAFSGKLLGRIDVGYSTDDVLEMSGDGKYLLAGGKNQNILLFSANDAGLLWSLFPINAELERIRRDEEDRRIASVAAENEAKRLADIKLERVERRVYISFDHYGDMSDPGDKRMIESDEPKESKVKKTAENSNAVWLRIHNDSTLPIEIPTQSMYLPNGKCFFEFPIGNKINGLCDNREINVRHGLQDKDGKWLPFGFDFGSSTILLPRTSALFPVPLAILKDGNSIVFDFKFQNSTDGKKVEDYGNPVTLRFSTADLPKN